MGREKHPSAAGSRRDQTIPTSVERVLYSTVTLCGAPYIVESSRGRDPFFYGGDARRGERQAVQ